MPWIVAGDFNMIRSLSKKKAGTRQLGRDFKAFQNFILNMGLVDTETINETFTWNKKRGGASQVASNLTYLSSLKISSSQDQTSERPFFPLEVWIIG